MSWLTSKLTPPVAWPLTPQIWGWSKYLSSPVLLRGTSHPHDGWLEPGMLTISRAISQPVADVVHRSPITAGPTPLIPFNEELQGAAGFDHTIHGKDCEKHIYFGNTEKYIYIHLYIYICTCFFLWAANVSIYCPGLANDWRISLSECPLMSCQQTFP